VTGRSEADSRLILASASPRRRELLARLGFPFDVRPIDVHEDPGRSTNPQIVAARIARTKAEAARLRDAEPLILAADTVVAQDEYILGKPDDAREAREMLTRLRGREHQVVTALAVMPAGMRSPLVRHPATRVTMRDYSDVEIEQSIARGDPFDKAGGYSIQDETFRPVTSYNGCYCNVVGLPLWSTIELLRRSGTDVSPKLDQVLPQCATCPLRSDT
jgi:septum formation protein